MSHDPPNDAEVKALRQIIDEVRASEPPDLDWARIEKSLAQRIELEGAARRRRKPAAWASLASFAVAAAAAALLIAQVGGAPPPAAPVALEREPVDLAAVPAERLSGELPTYMVAAMKPHSIVEAGDEPVRFALPGVATWVLAPDTRVIVNSVAVPHVITLERGTVHAEVVPRNADDELVESFAVVAGTTRVAVHGTVFSVERDGDRITVEVTRGAVTVGPASNRGITTGRLLVSPARAAFSIHGGELAAFAPARATKDPAMERALSPRAPSAQAEQTSETTRRSGQPEAATAPPMSRSAAADEGDGAAHLPALTADQARALVVACLRGDTAEGTHDRVVTISSQVTARVGPSGTVETVRFSPPVRPDLQERCGATLFHHRTQGDANLSFHVRVSR